MLDRGGRHGQGHDTLQQSMIDSSEKKSPLRKPGPWAIQPEEDSVGTLENDLEGVLPWQTCRGRGAARR